MSTATELARLTNARNTIRDKLIDLGIATSTDKLDVLASAVDSITNRGAVTATVQEGDTYTIPAGYHNGSGTVSGVAGGGNYQLQSKTVTPTKSQQSITPDSGYYGLSDVTVSAIPDAYQNVSGVTVTASEVISGKVFVSATGSNVTGTMPNNGAVSKVLTTTSTTYTVPSGFHNGSGSVSIALETKTVTPSTTSQSITPTTGKVLSKVTVDAIPANFAQVDDATAVASQLLEDEIAYTVTTTGVAQKITGTMPNNGAVTSVLDVTTGKQVYTIPSGYHNGSGTVSIVLESKTITPTKSVQSVTPSNGKVLSKVTVNAIPAAYQDVTSVNAAAGDVLDGKIIVASDGTEVEGTMTNNGAVSQTLSTSTTQYTVPAGYHNGSGTVQITLETKSVTPTTATQSVTPTTGKVLSKVTVNPIPAKFGDTTGDTATASDLLAGATAHTIQNGAAVQITGSMTNNGAINGSIDGLTTLTYSIPSGYTSGGSVSLTSDIEEALAAI